MKQMKPASGLTLVIWVRVGIRVRIRLGVALGPGQERRNILESRGGARRKRGIVSFYWGIQIETH